MWRGPTELSSLESGCRPLYSLPMDLPVPSPWGVLRTSKLEDLRGLGKLTHTLRPSPSAPLRDSVISPVGGGCPLASTGTSAILAEVVLRHSVSRVFDFKMERFSIDSRKDLD